MWSGKESACNAGDPASIPGSGRSAGKGIGYPLQYSQASLVTQLVKNPPAMWETWIRSLGWEDPLEKGKATHSIILAWRIPWTIYSSWSCRVGHDWATFTSLHTIFSNIYHSSYVYIHAVMWLAFVFPTIPQAPGCRNRSDLFPLNLQVVSCSVNICYYCMYLKI